MTIEQFRQLPEWDGTGGGYRYTNRGNWEYRIDGNGNILYLTQEKRPQVNIWCSASRLGRHLQHLKQIAARR